MSMKISGTSLSKLSEGLKNYMRVAVGELSLSYNFDLEEGLSVLGEIVVEKEGSRKVRGKRVIPSILLPWCGVVMEDWCKGVRYNRGLFSQCTNAPKDGSYCKTCSKSVKDGVPSYGLITERNNADWCCPKGKKPVRYSKIMEKLNVSKEQAIAEASKMGWTIEDEQFEVLKSRKGRPSKKTKETDGEPKKRGRPKKTKPVVEAAGTGDDLIAQLVQQAQQQNDNLPVATVNVAVTDDLEVEADIEADIEAEVVAEVVPEVEVEVEAEVEAEVVKKPKTVKKSAEEKAAEKQAKADAKAQAKADAKALKEAEKEAAKALKEAEKKAKADEKKAKAAAKKQSKKKDESPIEESSDEEDPIEELELKMEEIVLDEEEEDDSVEVIKFIHEGVEYLRDGDGTVYDMESQEEVGEWDDESKELTLN